MAQGEILWIYAGETEKRYHAPEEAVGEFVPLYPAYVPEGYELKIEDKLFFFQNGKLTEAIDIWGCGNYSIF